MLSLLFGGGIAYNCFALFVPIWSKTMGAPPSRILLSITIATSLAVVINPCIGWATDRFPASRLMTFGLLLCALGYVLVATAHSALELDFIYPIALAIGVSASSIVPAQAVVSRWFVRRRGLAMGFTASGVVVAGVLFPPLIVWALPLIGWRMVWLVGAGMLALVIAPLVFWGIRNHPPAGDPLGYLAVSQDQQEGTAVSMREIFLRPNFWLLTCISITILSTFFDTTVNSSSFVLNHGFDWTMAGFILSLLNFMAFVGQVLFGTLADRYGNRLALILLCLLAALGSAALCLVNSEAILILAIIPAGLCGGAWTVLPSALASEFGSASLGRAFGLITAIVPFAIITAPVVAHVKEQMGSYNPALLVLALMGLLGALLCLALRAPGDRAAAERMGAGHNTKVVP